MTDSIIDSTYGHCPGRCFLEERREWGIREARFGAAYADGTDCGTAANAIGKAIPGHSTVRYGPLAAQEPHAVGLTKFMGEITVGIVTASGTDVVCQFTI